MSVIQMVPKENRVDGSLALRMLPLTSIEVGRFSLREQFDESELETLAHSLRTQGVIQPLVVRPRAGRERSFELVIGERRYRAALIAGLSEVPVIVRELSDREGSELALLENVERQDLNPIEEACALKKLTEDFDLRQTDIAELLGCSRALVANTLRLLELPSEVIELIRNEHLSAGHGRALLRLSDEHLLIRLARRAARQSMSVRSVEKLVENMVQPGEERKLNTSFTKLAEKVSEFVGAKASLRETQSGKRQLTLTFPSDAAWKRFMRAIRS